MHDEEDFEGGTAVEWLCRTCLFGRRLPTFWDSIAESAPGLSSRSAVTTCFARPSKLSPFLNPALTKLFDAQEPLVSDSGASPASAWTFNLPTPPTRCIRIFPTRFRVCVACLYFMSVTWCSNRRPAESTNVLFVRSSKRRPGVAQSNGSPANLRTPSWHYIVHSIDPGSVVCEWVSSNGRKAANHCVERPMN